MSKLIYGALLLTIGLSMNCAPAGDSELVDVKVGSLDKDACLADLTTEDDECLVNAESALCDDQQKYVNPLNSSEVFSVCIAFKAPVDGKGKPNRRQGGATRRVTVDPDDLVEI